MLLTPYITVVFTLTAVLLLLIFRSKTQYVRMFFSAVFIAMLFNSLELLVSNPGLKLVFNQLKFLGVVFIAPSGLVFYLKFLKLEKFLTRRNIILLCVIPVLTLLMIATNSLHSLFFTFYRIEQTTQVSYVFFNPGPWFWVNSVYSYAVILLGLYALVIGCVRKPALYRGQNNAMLLSAFIAFFLNVLVILGFAADYGDVSIVSFAIATFFHYWAIYLYVPHGVINLARSFAVNEISNPIFIFNNEDKLLDANRSAAQMPKLELNDFADGGQLVADGRIYTMLLKPLYDKSSAFIGRVAVLNDVTELRGSVDRLQFSLSHDSLTGMMSRVAFLERLHSLKNPDVLPVSIVYFNISCMKLINTIFGYDFGDMIIKTVAEIISEVLDENKINALPAKMDGDEFAIVLFNADETTAAELAVRINMRCSERRYNDIFVGLYIGTATIRDLKENIDFSLKTAVGSSYRDKLIASRRYYAEVFNSLELSLNNNDYESPGHILRTRELCAKMAKKLQLAEPEAKSLDLLALTHDIGLLNTPYKLNEKAGRLTNEQWEDYKLHTVRGYTIALTSMELSRIANAILCHHERYDGYGYPNRIKGDDIPFLSRVLAVVDFYDEQMHPKIAGKAVKTPENAAEAVEGHSGTMFDPEIVAAFLEVVKEGE